MPTRRRFGPLILVASLALLAAACGGADDKSGTASAAPTTAAAAAAVASPLVGEWRRTQTCEESWEILTKAGFDKQVALENIAGNGFLPGVSSPDQIADPKHPCQGAVPQMHSHFFTADGQFGSKDHQGDQVDDGTYKLVDDRSFVVSKEFPDVTFHYRVSGDTIRFDPVVPSCAPACFEAVWSVMWRCPTRPGSASVEPGERQGPGRCCHGAVRTRNGPESRDHRELGRHDSAASRGALMQVLGHGG